MTYATTQCRYRSRINRNPVLALDVFHMLKKEAANAPGYIKPKVTVEDVATCIMAIQMGAALPPLPRMMQ